MDKTKERQIECFVTTAEISEATRSLFSNDVEPERIHAVVLTSQNGAAPASRFNVTLSFVTL